MSDTDEPRDPAAQSNTNSRLNVEEGACGGGGEEGLRPSTPFSDNGDNLSMEVRFSEGSSHHASDISSLSYQNLLDDDVPGGSLSRRDSEDSVDSYLPDYCDDIPRDEVYVTQNQQTSSYNDKLTDRISIQMTDDHIHISKENTSSSIINDGSLSGKSEPGQDVQDMNIVQRNSKKSQSMKAPLSIQDSFRKHELVINMRDQQRSRSLPPNEDSKDEKVKKRNSLEIRNNIPVTGEVKNYEKDIHIDNVTYTSQGAKPKIRKQSPGLACRVEETDENTEKIQNTRNVDKNATQIIDDLVQSSMARSAALNLKNTLMNDELKDEMPQTLINGSILIQKPADIENEYEYVKYSRIQEGNSYVGMRLAYNSSELETQNNNVINGLDRLTDNSRETTPEKLSTQSSDSKTLPSNLSEDMLTEIPLNGPDHHTVIGDENKLFTLSPENTECDSVEIESVVSEGDNDPSGMPNVEDGLSSSQTSDVEDGLKSEHNTPQKILQKKQQEELEKNLYGTECVNIKPREMDAEAIIDDLKLKREALDNAISEIKSAIQKSKGVSLEAPYKPDAEGDPIWVKREEPPVIPKGRSTHEVIHGEEETNNIEGKQVPDGRKKEEEQVYQMENEKDRLLENQFARNEGKVYQTPKGYDSDDEYDDQVRYTRRNKGKKYTQLPKDESLEQSSQSAYADSDSSHLRVDSVSMYGDNNSYTFAQDSHSDRRNSESLGSSEDFCSDSGVPSKQTYIQRPKEGDYDTDEETDQLLEKQYQGNQYVDIPELSHPPVNRSAQAEKRRTRAKEVQINDPENPSVLIEGVLFRAKYLGSTQLISEGQPSKAMRMMQAQEAVGRIKLATKGGEKHETSSDDTDTAPEGENQPSTEVDLFVSTEKIMVLNTDLQEIMMDHSLRTISYIADIGDILVIMARRRLMGSPGDTDSMRRRKQAKILCHVFDTEEDSLNGRVYDMPALTERMFSIGGNVHLPAYRDTKYEPLDLILEAQEEYHRVQSLPVDVVFVTLKAWCITPVCGAKQRQDTTKAQLIAQSIGQAFQVAYMEFLKANGIEDPVLMKEIDYQEVLNQQQIYGEELNMFSNKEMQKEVIVPKLKGEQLGVVIVESGWGSMVPTVVLANMAPAGPAARCGQLNIGDQIISVNGISLVGLPLSSCQTYIKGTKHQTVVKLTVVPCPPVVEVLIKRPDVKYQLGFSVQNGVICSLLRGGIAERGGVRVGHRIIEINNQSVVAVPHEKIVSLLANSVGEIHMKTMPTSIFRLLTGQETPHYL